MYYLNKIAGALLNPLAITLICLLIGMFFIVKNRRRFGLWLIAGGVAWVWLWSMPLMYRWVGMGLEGEWPVVLAEDAPSADAIVLLGGGMNSNTNLYPYAEMVNGADRVWHAARLYKAKKAPVVIAPGEEGLPSHKPILVDLGVPAEAIIIEEEARNTEENAKFVEKIVEGLPTSGENAGEGISVRKKVLLVTSAYHMRRSVLMFKKYAPNLDVIPAATDYEATVVTGHSFQLNELLPSADVLAANSCCFKEYVGYWGYRLLR